MRILCVGYRDWSLAIYKKLKNNLSHDLKIISSEKEFQKDFIVKFKPKIILFYGWSRIVPKEIVNSYDCIMLHPSPLPKYRGGSPIQNQIINDEKKSAVTLFLMTEGLDDGPIIRQKEFSLKGDLSKILKRIERIGYELTFEILSDAQWKTTEQNHSLATVFKRRKPDQSEITSKEIQSKSARYLYNKIRMLQDPYPNAYIVDKNGKKLFITDAKIEDD